MAWLWKVSQYSIHNTHKNISNILTDLPLGGRFVVIDISAGPCTYGKIETEEGSVSSKTLPRLRNTMFPQSSVSANHHSTTHDNFIGQLAAIIGITVQHVIAPDVRFETVDLATRLLVPIIVLQNHNRFNIMEKGKNYSIDMEAIKAEVHFFSSKS